MSGAIGKKMVQQARFGQPAVYNATPPTLPDGAPSALAVDANQRVYNTQAPTVYLYDSMQAYNATTEQASLTAGSLNADLMPSTDVSVYKFGSIQTGGTWSGTLTVQGANDNSSFNTVAVYNLGSLTTSQASGITANGHFGFAITHKFVRIRMTSYASGTATGTLKLDTLPVAPLLGVQMVSSGGNSTTPIAAGTAGNTVIKASAGRLCRVLVTTTGTNPMLIYDNATTNSGTIIGALPASPAIGSYEFHAPAANGITVDGDASNPAVTISWT